MDDKARALGELRSVFDQWKRLAARLTEAELTAPQADGLSVRDVVGHLWGWQRVTAARLEAARAGRDPLYPAWTAGGDPDDEPRTDEYNARILEMSRARPWAEAYRQWREGFLEVLTLAAAIPEATLTARGRFPWLGEGALIDVLWGTCDHHREHLEELM